MSNPYRAYHLIQQLKQTRNTNTPLFQVAMFSLFVAFLLGLEVFIFKLNFWWPVLTFLLGLSMPVIIYCVYWRPKKFSDDDAASEFDRKYAGKNRLEAMLNLKSVNHPLKNYQQMDTTRHYKKITVPKLLPPDVWGFAIVMALLIQLLLLFISILRYDSITPPVSEGEVFLAEQSEYAVEAVEAITADEIEIIDAPAELELHAPYPEIEASSLDEIIWAGEAQAPRDLSDLQLSLMVNGTLMDPIPVEDTVEGKTGELKMEGAFYLDEYSLGPFDIVSYYLEATDTLNGEVVQVFSEPQFIRIRPENKELLDSPEKPEKPEGAEETEGAEGSGPDMEQAIEVLNEVYRLMDEELIIIKRTVASQNTYSQSKSKGVELIEAIKVDQQNTADSMDLLFESVESLPPNVYDGLKRAQEEMGVAMNALSELQTDHVDAPGSSYQASIRSENIALSHLVGTLRNLQKMLMDEDMEGNPAMAKTDPFKDMQEYVLDKEDVDKNLGARMDKMIAEQSDANASMSGAKPEDAMGEQGEVAEDLKEILREFPLSEEALKSLHQAQREMREALSGLDSGDSKAAKESGEEALANLQKANEVLSKEADEQMAKALDASKQELAQAKDQLEEGSKGSKGSEGSGSGSDSGQMSASDLAASAMDRLDETFDWQRESGELQNAQKIANLLKSIQQELGEAGMAALDPAQAGVGEAVENYEKVIKKIIQHEKHDSTIEAQLTDLDEAIRELEEAQLEELETTEMNEVEIRMELGIIEMEMEEFLTNLEAYEWLSGSGAGHPFNFGRFQDLRSSYSSGMKISAKTVSMRAIVEMLKPVIRKDPVTSSFSGRSGTNPFLSDEKLYFEQLNKD